jgi:hypothetical protein
MTVLCELTIEFNHIRAGLDSLFEGQAGIFRKAARRPAMGYFGERRHWFDALR